MSDHPQQTVFDFLAQQPRLPVFPTTRYQGSKRRLADWIWESVRGLQFDTVADAFGGTGAVAYRFKRAGKQVTYNDILAFNHTIGLALIENGSTRLSDEEVNQILQPDPRYSYSDFIATTFQDVYFTHDENLWLDIVTQNIHRLLTDPYKRAIALFALYQSCLVKRPYNLFHRKNLYMRHAKVKRSFGNKRTWDTPFEWHFRKFVREANAAVFDNHRCNRALNQDAVHLPTGYDLVYIDPPYLNGRGVGVDYHAFYHFLEGLTHYDRWPDLIDHATKHRTLQRQPSLWHDKDTIRQAFRQVIGHFAESILVISYRSDGIPTREELVEMLYQHKSTVVQAALPQQYALSKQTSKELLLIGA
mgnify:CR=1 FL=1